MWRKYVSDVVKECSRQKLSLYLKQRPSLSPLPPYHSFYNHSLQPTSNSSPVIRFCTRLLTLLIFMDKWEFGGGKRELDSMLVKQKNWPWLYGSPTQEISGRGRVQRVREHPDWQAAVGISVIHFMRKEKWPKIRTYSWPLNNMGVRDTV